ncbi:Defects in morphology protein 1-like protein [Cordyceps fumosorosea ARSEF 2679]|uniref:Defects in morphology protein 1-like protein n=1 Tax=Cordyceps fumosorosea (strain ARSEF 2679) TaxID=1081104 RepID=A0A168CAI5_CORFA|nr:Defects in morphology protein 1-like protein [Cordyceps fumosorosea ARSEF 2679]OAA71153.1 Defects in morphology protein 1-like protein [Cordyceps fumosorosea ARSEF 2679]
MAADDGDFPFDLSPDEERLLIRLVTDVETKKDSVAAAIDALPARSDFAPDAPIDDGRAPTAAEEDAAAESANTSTAALLRSTSSQISSPTLKRASECPEDTATEVQSAPVREDFEDEFDDHRSPLKRFRSFPRRPLTVSDLTSGAWCELQYWYTLSRLPGGRRTRTAAMQQGSALHQKLEDEVHTTVEVEVLSREDGFGVRLWNLIQGLRTLRGTGLTRELEIWGVVDGNLVNGVIDYLSYENPNPEFELELSQEEAQEEAKQAKVTDYFASTTPDKENKPEGPKVYIADVKTRGSLRKVPDSVLRPAKIQLLLYHRFLADLAAGHLDFYKVFRRYGLDPDAPFSDTFLAQMAGSHDEMLDTSPSSSWQSSEGGDLPYRSLRELLPLVEREVGLTFPAGLVSVGPMLRVEYVHRGDGFVIGHHDFAASRSALDGYVGAYMAWWRGERRAAGVSLDEAFKCRTCEFADTCTWRAAMDARRVQSVRERLRAAGSKKPAT